MSAQLSTVAHRVTALCSAYHDGAHALAQIKAKRKGLDISAQELELSITHGESSVSNQYHATYKRFGEPFAHGDCMPRNLSTPSTSPR